MKIFDMNDFPELEKGDIIQCINKSSEWYGCVWIVEEVKSFGCKAFIKIPGGNIYCRFNFDEFMYIGLSYCED
jgi:hypothetical protein